MAPGPALLGQSARGPRVDAAAGRVPERGAQRVCAVRRYCHLQCHVSFAVLLTQPLGRVLVQHGVRGPDQVERHLHQGGVQGAPRLSAAPGLRVVGYGRLACCPHQRPPQGPGPSAPRPLALAPP